MRNKKAISIALSAVMAFTTAFGMTTVKANAEEKEKIVVYVAAEGKNASGSAVEMGKTAVQLDEGAVAEDAIKIALDKSHTRITIKFLHLPGETVLIQFLT